VRYDSDTITHTADVYDAPSPETRDWFRRYGAEFHGSCVGSMPSAWRASR